VRCRPYRPRYDAGDSTTGGAALDARRLRRAVRGVGHPDLGRRRGPADGRDPLLAGLRAAGRQTARRARWGVWLDGRFWSDGAPTTLHARNVTSQSTCSLHLESGTEVVIVDGESHPTRASASDLGARLSAGFAKYHDLGYRPGTDAWAGEEGGGLRVLTPRTALAWFAFPADATRFRFARPPEPVG